MTQLMRPAELAHNKTTWALLGLATHYLLHHGEWDNAGHIILGVWLLLFGGLAGAEYMYDPRTNSIGSIVRVTTVAATAYFGALTTSILIYRGFFHRLRRIPGPFLARFSKFYAIFAGVFPDFQYFKWSEKLYKEYEIDVIRTGPRDVTVYCADAVPLIHGAMSRCRKGPWYSAASHIGGSSTHTTRDREDHKRRRKTWDYASMQRRCAKIATQPSVRITNWINFYSFDVMGDIGFSRSFGMVEKGEEADVIKMLHESMAPLSVFGQITWGLNLATRTAAGAKALIDHIEWTANVLLERSKVTPQESDIFSRLLDPNDDKITMDLNADSRLMVVAGSDTTAATLSWISYELCKNPEMQAKLRKAIDEIEPKKSHLDVDDVSDCAFLDGVINEALRLHPAVPSGVQRETPPEGITLPNGTYIPGGIIIWMPIYCIQRDPRYWKDPLTFLPERWTDEQPDAVMDKRALLVFSAGPYNCVGQKLAMLELRSVTANLIRLFEMSFANGEDGNEMETKSRDCFTTNVGKLDVKLTPRYKA